MPKDVYQPTDRATNAGANSANPVTHWGANACTNPTNQGTNDPVL